MTAVNFGNYCRLHIQSKFIIPLICSCFFCVYHIFGHRSTSLTPITSAMLCYVLLHNLSS